MTLNKDKVRFNTIWICKECGELDPCIFISKGTALGPIDCPYQEWDADWKEYGWDRILKAEEK